MKALTKNEKSANNANMLEGAAMNSASANRIGDAIVSMLTENTNGTAPNRAALVWRADDGFHVRDVPHDSSVLNIERDLLKHLDAQPFSDEWLLAVRDAIDGRLVYRQLSRQFQAAQHAAPSPNAGLDTPEDCIRMDAARSQLFAEAVYDLADGFNSLQAIAEQLPDISTSKGEINPRRVILAIARLMEPDFQTIFRMMNGDDIEAPAGKGAESVSA